MKSFSIKNGTRQPLQRVPFSRIAEKVLGPSYELSLVFVGDTRMRTLNHSYRGKDTTTDILAFPLSKSSGEIFISQNEAAKKSKKFSLTEKQYIAYVFIHGLLHLKGMEHGRTMERHEDTWCKKFKIPAPKR